MIREHAHELDGKLHPGCPECAEIVDRLPLVQREKQADALAEHFRQLADRKSAATDRTRGDLT